MKELLYDYQRDALRRMHNGCILHGSVGSGKSRTGLAYYFEKQGGVYKSGPAFKEMDHPKDLYIITVASKRDKGEWLHELAPFRLHPSTELNYYKNKVVVDSWNNIKKYVAVKNAMFIFDEQRLIGTGEWVKAFLRISKNNEWIILSATPGDSYIEYLPVWLANGYFHSKTEFNTDHVIFSSYVPYPKIIGYRDTAKLDRLRGYVLINMDYAKPNCQHHTDILCSFNQDDYNLAAKSRWNMYKDYPIENAGELCYILRRVVNSDETRLDNLYGLWALHSKMIVFYNFDYERELIIKMCRSNGIIFSEWSGHNHQPVPESDSWLYLCQYTAAAEGWESTATDTIVFYSQNYSYKVMTQACGRIDRLNSPFRDLYYYHFTSDSSIDKAIKAALSKKEKFNEMSFAKAWHGLEKG